MAPRKISLPEQLPEVPDARERFGEQTITFVRHRDADIIHESHAGRWPRITHQLIIYTAMLLTSAIAAISLAGLTAALPAPRSQKGLLGCLGWKKKLTFDGNGKFKVPQVTAVQNRADESGGDVLGYAFR